MKEYIERAALKRELAPYEENDFSQQMDVILAIVDAQPAADVVEVRHGYWIDHHSGGSFCSACKRWVPYSHHPKYCETCGARMDKEDKHEAD